jgi:hypothetical protein
MSFSHLLSPLYWNHASLLLRGQWQCADPDPHNFAGSGSTIKAHGSGSELRGPLFPF